MGEMVKKERHLHAVMLVVVLFISSCLQFFLDPHALSSIGMSQYLFK